MPKIPLADLPTWPLYLSREEAARYLGRSPATFDFEVRAGIWPEGVRAGEKLGRILWYRPDLEATAKRRDSVYAKEDSWGDIGARISARIAAQRAERDEARKKRRPR